jgi:hypothetical protein
MHTRLHARLSQAPISTSLGKSREINRYFRSGDTCAYSTETNDGHFSPGVQRCLFLNWHRFRRDVVGVEKIRIIYCPLSRYRVTPNPHFSSTAMSNSKKTDQIIPGLDIDGLSGRPSLEPEYVIDGAFPEQRHHLINSTNSMLSLLVNQMKRGIEQPPLFSIQFLIGHSRF